MKSIATLAVLLILGAVPLSLAAKPPAGSSKITEKGDQSSGEAGPVTLRSASKKDKAEIEKICGACAVDIAKRKCERCLEKLAKGLDKCMNKQVPALKKQCQKAADEDKEKCDKAKDEDKEKCDKAKGEDKEKCDKAKDENKEKCDKAKVEDKEKCQEDVASLEEQCQDNDIDGKLACEEEAQQKCGGGGGGGGPDCEKGLEECRKVNKEDRERQSAKGIQCSEGQEKAKDDACQEQYKQCRINKATQKG